MNKISWKKTNLDWLSAFFKYSLLFVAVLYITFYLVAVYFRIQYPFELQWHEGGMVDIVIRILSGKKIYVSPSLEFVPSIYAPLYFYVSALVSHITDIGFLPLRLVSFTSSIGCFFLIFLFVRKETGQMFYGFMAAGLFAATFRISSSWFDIARVDTLFLFLLLISIYLIRFSHSNKSVVLAGIFMSLSFFTKQTAIVISLPIMLYFIISNRREAILFIGTFTLIAGLGTLLMNHVHDGWYKYFLFDLPRHHPLDKEMFINFWRLDLFSHLLIACIFSFFAVFPFFFDSDRKACAFYSMAATGMLGASWASRIHVGGSENVLFPAYAFISILFGIGLYAFFKLLPPMSEKKRVLIEIAVYLLCIIQFFSLKYNPAKQIPTNEDLLAGKKFINAMADMEGEIFLPEHGYLPTLAGKKSYAFGMAIRDVLRAHHSDPKKKLTYEINESFRNKRFNVIITDLFELQWEKDVEPYYRLKGKVFNNETVFWTVSGIKKRPEFIYVPK